MQRFEQIKSLAEHGDAAVAIKQRNRSILVPCFVSAGAITRAKD